jgi:hypothetical protein
MILAAGPKNSNTRDIINAIARALPVAVAQIRERNIANPGGSIVQNATKIGKYTRRKFQYKKDGLIFQDIKLPTALERTKIGDCKSISLYIAAHLTALGIENGLRFAAYDTPQLTHVYNWYLDENKNLHTLDACLPDLKESPRATKIEDMQTRIIAGVPLLSENMDSGMFGRAERQARRQERRQDRRERREDRRAEGKGFFQVAKKVTLAPGRGAFLLVLKANFRGLATRLNKIPGDKLAGFWGKLGGDKKKLFAAIKDGKDKKPFLGMGAPDEIGVDPVTVAAGTSAPIIIAAVKFLKDLGIDPGDVLEAVKAIAPNAEPLGQFEAADPETDEAAMLTKQTPTGTSTPGKDGESGTGFKISPVLIVGGLAAVYLLTMKKKGRK